jgi:hypothetical protein
MRVTLGAATTRDEPAGPHHHAGEHLGGRLDVVVAERRRVAWIAGAMMSSRPFTSDVWPASTRVASPVAATSVVPKLVRFPPDRAAPGRTGRLPKPPAVVTSNR